MPIVVSINSGKDFEPVSEGVHSVVLADIVDLGMIPTAFGTKHKVQFVWLADEADEEGKTKRLFKRYTMSLHEKASLRKDVKLIRGRDIETTEFDLEELLGSQNQVVVQHSEDPKTNKVYANIQAIMKPKPGIKLAIPADFTRKKDKPQDGAKSPNSGARSTGGGRAAAAAVLAPASSPITDDDMPF